MEKGDRRPLIERLPIHFGQDKRANGLETMALSANEMLKRAFGEFGGPTGEDVTISDVRRLVDTLTFARSVGLMGEYVEIPDDIERIMPGFDKVSRQFFVAEERRCRRMKRLDRLSGRLEASAYLAEFRNKLDKGDGKFSKESAVCSKAIKFIMEM